MRELFCIFLLLFCNTTALTHHHPGDIFKEYIWLPTMVKEKEKFLRVGGKLDYKSAINHMPAKFHDQGFLTLTDSMDLSHATHAEVVFEMVQSHDGTKGLTINLNNKGWIKVPPIPTLPRSQHEFMLHTYPSVEIPLEYLYDDRINKFKLKVDSTQRFNWPQHIFYGIIFRIYYDSGKVKEHISGEIQLNTRSNNLIEFNYHPASKSPKIKTVDYIGYYRDLNWEGDGRYEQWHGHSHLGELRNHIGGSTTSPYTVHWDTKWLPDQWKPIEVMAKVTYENGISSIAEETVKFNLDRNYSVELCKPYHQPQNWVTREDTFQSKFAIHGDLSNVASYQLAWRSWSPCYGRGVFINGQKVWNKSDPCYGYAEHLVEVEDTEYLLHGENIITTGMTPLIDNKMVHGMEVQYPGIMIKIKYDLPITKRLQITEGLYEDRPHFIVGTKSAIYYYDKAGGGLSRMLDRNGVDWIDFKREPWGTYPASAASAYRGIPNFIHGSDQAGAGHPGHDQCNTEKVDSNTLLSTSNDGIWQWQWDFFDEYATVKMLKISDNHPYWFLYEGVPGGKYDPVNQYYGTDKMDEPSRRQWDYQKGNKDFSNYRWAYFGHTDSDRVLFVKQKEDDLLSDTFSYLGNSEKAINSDDGMIVFGFGRADGAKPLLRKPHTFYLGFIEQKVDSREDHSTINTLLEAIN